MKDEWSFIVPTISRFINWFTGTCTCVNETAWLLVIASGWSWAILSQIWFDLIYCMMLIYAIVLWAQLLLTLEVAVLAVAAKVAFGLVLINGLANQKQFRSATPSQSYHCFVPSSLWWRSGYTLNQWPSSPNLTHLLPLSKIQALLRAFYTMRYINDAKGLLYILEVLRCFTI